MGEGESRWGVGDFWCGVCGVGLGVLVVVGPVYGISEGEFIEKVLAQDKLLEEAQIGVDIKRIERDASRDNYINWKANLTLDAGYRYMDLDRDTTSTHSYTKNSENYPASIALNIEKRFMSNPGILKMGIKHDKDDTDEEHYKQHVPSKNNEESEYAAEHYVQFAYPFLKNDGKLRTYHKDIIELEQQQLSFYETTEDFLNDRLDDYLEWVLYYEQARINEEYLARLRRLEPADEAEVALLQSAVYQVEKYQADTQLQLRGIKQKLAILLDDQSLLREVPTYDLGKRVELKRVGLMQYLREVNRDLLRIALDIEINRIDIKYYENRKLPSLDFVVRAEYNISDRNTSANMTNDSQKRYEAGLEFVVPVGGDISTRASLAKELLAVRRLEISYQDKLQDLLADLELLSTVLSVDDERLQGAIGAAERSARIEGERYRAEEASMRDLLQAYRDVRTARLDRIQELVAYQEHSIEYDNLLDRIIKTPVCFASAAGCGE